ncbi:uncharacterized protein RJT20DRAFT_4139 [Scheffersomyces xylosifermentans]|uniref:uncharacterized protein n=1 Tax=Scheffersomyces xylosifermentans TaxID=1304137 RepID=UPI00315CB741
MTTIRPLLPRDFVKSMVDATPELRLIAEFYSLMLATFNSIIDAYVHPSFARSKAVITTTLGRIWLKLVSILLSATPNYQNVLQYSWLLSHFVSATSAIISLSLMFDFNSENPYRELSYSVGVYSSISTYLLVTYRHCILLLSLRKKPVPNVPTSRLATSSSQFNSLVRSENTHLLGMSILVAVSATNPLKLVPMLIYSSLNLADFVTVELFPDWTFAQVIRTMLQLSEESFLVGAAIVELLLLFLYLKDSILGVEAFTFFMYAILCCLRLENSTTSQQAIQSILNFSYKVLNKFEHTKGAVACLEVLEAILTADATDASDEPNTNEPTGEKAPYPFPRRDRVASLAFERYTIVNDLHME